MKYIEKIILKNDEDNLVNFTNLSKKKVLIMIVKIGNEGQSFQPAENDEEGC